MGVVGAGPDQEWYHYTLEHGFNAHRVTFDMESVGISDVWVAAYKPGSDGWCSIIWPKECNLAGYCWVLGVVANAGSVSYWPNDYFVAVASTRTWGQVETASVYVLTADEEIGPNAETE